MKRRRYSVHDLLASGVLPREVRWNTSQPTSDDVTTCTACEGILFRTNVDGHWHHRDLPDDGHDPEPAEGRTSAEAAELYRQAQVIDQWPEGDYR